MAKHDKDKPKHGKPPTGQGSPGGPGSAPRRPEPAHHQHDENWDHDHDEEAEVPEGSALLPEIPDGLVSNPANLAIIEAVVFLSGSDDEVVNPLASEEILGRMIDHMQQMKPDHRRVFLLDLAALKKHATAEKWDDSAIDFLGQFADLLSDKGSQ